MAELPELDIARVRCWCEERVPAHARDQVRVEYDIGPRQLTIVEGTSQVQLGLIARGVLDHDLWWD